MSREFAFHLGLDQLRIEDRKTGARLEMENRVVVHSRRGMILSLGQSLDDVRARFRGRFDPSEIQAVSLFGPEETNLVYELRVIGHLRRMLGDKVGKPVPVRLFAPRPGKGPDYSLSIPGYEGFPPARRASFEHALQAHLRVRRLVINGRNVEISARQRDLEIMVRRLFVQWLPAIAAIVAFLAAPPPLRTDRFLLLAYVLAVLGLLYYGGRVAWMLLAPRILPLDYCLYMLRNVRGRCSPLDQWLARILWQSHAPRA